MDITEDYIGDLNDACQREGQRCILNLYDEQDDLQAEFIGDFKEGKKHGEGSFKYSDGDYLIANWKDGILHEFHGPATRFNGEKEFFEMWENGNLISPLDASVCFVLLFWPV